MRPVQARPLSSGSTTIELRLMSQPVRRFWLRLPPTPSRPTGVPGHVCPVREVMAVTETRYCGCRDRAGGTPARRYRIIVSGRLGMVGCEAFRDLHIGPHGTDTALT